MTEHLPCSIACSLICEFKEQVRHRIVGDYLTPHGPIDPRMASPLPVFPGASTLENTECNKNHADGFGAYVIPKTDRKRKSDDPEPSYNYIEVVALASPDKQLEMAASEETNTYDRQMLLREIGRACISKIAKTCNGSERKDRVLTAEESTAVFWNYRQLVIICAHAKGKAFIDASPLKGRPLMLYAIDRIEFTPTTAAERRMVAESERFFTENLQKSPKLVAYGAGRVPRRDDLDRTVLADRFMKILARMPYTGVTLFVRNYVPGRYPTLETLLSPTSVHASSFFVAELCDERRSVPSCRLFLEAIKTFVYAVRTHCNAILSAVEEFPFDGYTKEIIDMLFPVPRVATVTRIFEWTFFPQLGDYEYRDKQAPSVDGDSAATMIVRLLDVYLRKELKIHQWKCVSAFGLWLDIRAIYALRSNDERTARGFLNSTCPIVPSNSFAHATERIEQSSGIPAPQKWSFAVERLKKSVMPWGYQFGPGSMGIATREIVLEIQGRQDSGHYAYPDIAFALSQCGGSSALEDPKTCPPLTFKFKDEVGEGHGVDTEAVRLFFECLPGHSLFDYDENIDMLRFSPMFMESGETSPCAACEKHVRFNPIGPRISGCKLAQDNIANNLSVMIREAIRNKCTAPYLLDPIFFGMDSTSRCRAMMACGSLPFKTLENLSRDKLTSFGLIRSGGAPLSDTSMIGDYLLEVMSPKLPFNDPTMKFAPFAEISNVNLYLNQICHLVSGRIYGPLSARRVDPWATPEVALGLFVPSTHSGNSISSSMASHPSTAQSVTGDHKDFSSLFTATLTPAFFQTTLDAKQLLETPICLDDTSRRSISATINANDDLVVRLRETTTTHHLRRWLVEATGAQRLALYVASTAKSSISLDARKTITEMTEGLSVIGKESVYASTTLDSRPKDGGYSTILSVSRLELSPRRLLAEAFRMNRLRGSSVKVTFCKGRVNCTPSSQTCIRALYMGNDYDDYAAFSRQMETFLANAATFSAD